MKIGCVIVTYNPDITLLNKSISSLLFQVDNLCIVDNGSASIEKIKELANIDKKILLISLADNKGIAFATNEGLKFFIDKSFDYVITSDQDTVFPNNYVENIKKNIVLFKNEIQDIAAFAPVFFEENQNKIAPVYQFKKKKIVKIPLEKDYLDVFQAIASGLVLNLSLIQNIGLMNEDLFIDLVDFEWGWRVNYCKKRIVCCKNMQIVHKLGDFSKNLGSKNVSMHSYVRNYYITRNSFYLALKTKYLPLYTRMILFFKSFLYIIGYTVLSDKHIKNFIYTNKGFFDAVTGRLGKLDDK